VREEVGIEARIKARRRPAAHFTGPADGFDLT
jgi:hypothetical protein